MMWPFNRPKPPAPAPGHPAAYIPDPDRPDVFDPALKHYPRAFVKGPPAGGDEARALQEARSRLLHAALRELARSPARDQLLLRGSLTLEAWFPDHARRAHDLDFVVRDASWAPDGAPAAILLPQLRGAVCDALTAAEVRVLVDEITLDSIWTYERAEGRRLSVPWLHAGSIRDVIQVDVVFREPIQDAPALEVLRDERGARDYRTPPTGPSLWFASRAESLAWKLLWLDTDMNPQAKDVYDAVLLAEDGALSLDLLCRVCAAKGAPWKHGTDTHFMRAWHVEWESFAIEYPALAADDRSAWLDRLARTLRLLP